MEIMAKISQKEGRKCNESFATIVLLVEGKKSFTDKTDLNYLTEV